MEKSGRGSNDVFHFASLATADLERSALALLNFFNLNCISTLTAKLKLLGQYWDAAPHLRH